MQGINQTTGPLTLIPAYGRIYKSSQDAVSDWTEGKDFKIIGGPYCSIRDSINLRFDASTVWIAWNHVDCVRIM